MRGAYAAFTLMDASIKILGGQCYVVRVVFFNALFALVTVTVLGGIRRRLARVCSPQWRLHLLCWAIGLPGGLAIFWASPRRRSRTSTRSSSPRLVP